jgi:hypothetical protein
MGNKRDPLNCPYCEAEVYGYSISWGFSPEGWDEMERMHRERHVTPITDSKPLEIDCSVSYMDVKEANHG